MRSVLRISRYSAKPARDEERRKTEIYIQALQSEFMAAYLDAADDILSQSDISDDQVVYTSRFAPMIVAKVSSADIETLAENDDVTEIDLFEKIEPIECTFDGSAMKAQMDMDDIIDDIGLDGTGTKIGIYETDNVASVPDDSSNNYDLDTTKVTVVGTPTSPGDHATWCAAIAAGDYGVAPEADIVSASTHYDWINYDWNNYSNAQLSTLEALMNSGVSVINVSWIFSRISNYTSWEKYMDYLIDDKGVIMVCATGNDSNSVISGPAMSYNCVAVNGFANGIINDYSYDHDTGCYKPDVIAYSFNNGTSSAAPVITGMIALLHQYKPSLALHPELSKAILIGSVHQKANRVIVNGVNVQIFETLSSGLTNRQGAGIPSLYNMISIAAQHSYYYGVLGSTNEDYIQIVQPPYGATNMNISLAYLQTNVAVNNANNTQDNVNLILKNTGFAADKSSTQGNSSTEMIYTPLTNNNKYIIDVKRLTGTMQKVKYAVAWSTDYTLFYPTVREEGIYYVRNENSDHYLSKDGLSVKQKAFSGANTQLWILQNQTLSGYYMKSANGTENTLDIGANMSGNYYKVAFANTANYIHLYNRGDGTFSFERYGINNNVNYDYFLGIYNNSQSVNAVASWYPKNMNNNAQKWYLEYVGYKRGDVDMDGEITEDDSDLALQIYSDIMTGSGTHTNIEMFLADYDGDGQVTSTDASEILLNTTA